MPQELLDSFGGHVDRIDVVAAAVPLMVLAAVATHFTARTSLRYNASPVPLEEAATTGSTEMAMKFMRLTPWIFPAGVLLGGLVAAFPVAILLYWLTNNLWTLAQQHVVFRKLAAEEARRPAAVAEPVPVESVSGPGPEPRPGAKPVAPRLATRRPTSASARTGGRAAAGRRAGARRGGR
jgi:YidC/Oxa1 family membrane protein insertase